MIIHKLLESSNKVKYIFDQIAYLFHRKLDVPYDDTVIDDMMNKHANLAIEYMKEKSKLS